MAVPKWLFVLTDLQGNQLGELTNASSKQVVLPLNRMPTASFQVLTSNSLSKYLLDPTWDGLVKAYRNSTLRFIGPVVSTSEQFDSSSGQTISVNAASPIWRLGYRMLGNTSVGWSLGNATTPYDLGFIAGQMIAAGNAAGYTGIDLGTITASSSGSAGTYWFKDVLTAIGEIATGLNSFDFEVAPTEPTNVGQAWPRIGIFNASNLIGTTKSEAIFEYGSTNANVVQYGRSIDRSTLCNKAYIQQPAAADHSGILTSADATSQALRGLFEALVDDGGTQWDTLRQALADENVLVRKQARQVVTFTPATNASPSPFTDYIVGDQIRARITVNSLNILDAMLRVWGITFNEDQNGNETVSLELIQP